MANPKPPNLKALGALLAGVALVGCCCLRSWGGDDTDASRASAPETITVTTAAPARLASLPLSPTPSAAATQAVKPKPTVWYADCGAAEKAGAAPLYSGDPGYRKALDANEDGVACDVYDAMITDGDDGGDSGDGADAYYANCSQARAAGAAPLYRGDPGYSRKLDRDGDGTACE